MGDTEMNDWTPFQLNYVYDEADKWGEEPWHAEAKKCNEAYDVSSIRINPFSPNSIETTKTKTYYCYLMDTCYA